jgi:hypothetical protein
LTKIQHHRLELFNLFFFVLWIRSPTPPAARQQFGVICHVASKQVLGLTHISQAQILETRLHQKQVGLGRKTVEQIDSDEHLSKESGFVRVQKVVACENVVLLGAHVESKASVELDVAEFFLVDNGVVVGGRRHL